MENVRWRPDARSAQLAALVDEETDTATDVGKRVGGDLLSDLARVGGIERLLRVEPELRDAVVRRVALDQVEHELLQAR